MAEAAAVVAPKGSTTTKEGCYYLPHRFPEAAAAGAVAAAVAGDVTLAGWEKGGGCQRCAKCRERIRGWRRARTGAVKVGTIDAAWRGR